MSGILIDNLDISNLCIGNNENNGEIIINDNLKPLTNGYLKD